MSASSTWPSACYRSTSVTLGARIAQRPLQVARVRPVAALPGPWRLAPARTLPSGRLSCRLGSFREQGGIPVQKFITPLSRCSIVRAGRQTRHLVSRFQPRPRTAIGHRLQRRSQLGLSTAPLPSRSSRASSAPPQPLRPGLLRRRPRRPPPALVRGVGGHRVGITKAAPRVAPTSTPSNARRANAPSHPSPPRRGPVAHRDYRHQHPKHPTAPLAMPSSDPPGLAAGPAAHVHLRATPLLRAGRNL